MATHSSVLAWRIPGTGEPGGLPSMRSHRVGHDWSNLPAAAVICFNSLFLKSVCACTHRIKLEFLWLPVLIVLIPFVHWWIYLLANIYGMPAMC